MTTTTRRRGRPDRGHDRDLDRTATAPDGVPSARAGHGTGPDRRGGSRGRAPRRGRAWRRGVVVLLLVAAGAWAVQGTDLGAVRDRLASGVARATGTQTATVLAGERAAPDGPVGAAGSDASDGAVGSDGAPGAGGRGGDDERDGPEGAAGLDPELQRRFDAAVAAAAADGVELTLTSGRRTAEEQQRLVDQAVERYGVPEAYRWVLPPDRSAHVRGLAVDVGPTDGALWLGEHGLELGLCRTYANEMWHFEMLPDGATACPEQQPDSSWAW